MPIQVDPELRAISRVLPSTVNVRHGVRLPRAGMAVAASIAARRGVEKVRIDDHVTARFHRPRVLAEPCPALLWIHGGGYLMGSARQDDTYCRRIAHLANVVVVAVDYRLAPEFPYPVPLDDCYSALRWLSQQSWADESRIGIGGASAGGGLTAALAQLALDRAEITPALQLMLYPMLDDRTAATTRKRTGLMWAAADNRRAWELYLGGADPAAAVPARRPSVAGLPPAWIGVGTLDLFHTECVAYGRRLADAGVDCRIEVVDGAFHGFDLIAPNARVSLEFLASQCRFIRDKLQADVV